MTQPTTIFGPKVLLIGPIGTGKTHSIRTLLDAGLDVYGIFTEQSPLQVLADTDPARLHWRYIPPAAAGWSSLMDMAKKVNTLSYKMLCGLPDIGKDKFTQYFDVINTLSNYTCDRTGTNFGPVDQLDPRRSAVVVDSLSGLSSMMIALAIGLRPTMDKSDYGTAQRNIMAFLMQLTTGIPCPVVVMAHPEKVVNELTSTLDIFAASVGKAIAADIPKNFSDVIMTQRNGAKFSWSTIFPNADLVARHLPWAADIVPSFVPLIAAWKANLSAVK